MLVYQQGQFLRLTSEESNSPERGHEGGKRVRDRTRHERR